ncbi:MAG: pas/pac sensor protein, partial [Bacteroidetes bacterium]
EKKQKDIIESIQYSQIIQKSILPHRRDIWRTLPQSFVLYKPKDIVAGDFYWFHIIKDYCLIAVADCTGHGIPGAFMSILCNDKLNEAINYTHQIDEILYFTNLNIKRTLKQLDNTSTSKDGMDIILVKIPYERVQKRETPIPIEFAGANRPLFLFRNHKQTTEVFKTTKASIGGFTDTEQTFQKYSLDLYTDDVIYLTSDGYIDQFGGSKNKKLMTTGFVNLINQIGNLHYQKQKQELETFFNEWKGTNEQIDDVCIIGIKI